MRLKKITLIIEEVLLLKLLEFFGFHSQTEELVNKDNDCNETQGLLTETYTAHSKRYLNPYYVLILMCIYVLLIYLGISAVLLTIPLYFQNIT